MVQNVFQEVHVHLTNHQLDVQQELMDLVFTHLLLDKLQEHNLVDLKYVQILQEELLMLHVKQ